MPKDYAKTLNLPKTDFSMRANLPTREPVTQEKWEKENIYGEMLKKNEGHDSFVLHDGPPFSNSFAVIPDIPEIADRQYRLSANEQYSSPIIWVVHSLTSAHGRPSQFPCGQFQSHI